jgi:hypothetical protein
MSAPAANAFSLPVMTITEMPGSASNPASAASISSASASFSALSRCGRLSVMIATRSRVSTRMFS